MTQEDMNQIDVQAILNVFVYTDIHIDWHGTQDLTLKEIVDNPVFQDRLTKAIEEGVVTKQYKEILENAVQTPDIGNIKLRDQSMKDGKFDMKHLIAATFEDTEGNLIVAYRGTGDGKWVDNGVGMVSDSQVQNYALEYFDYVASENPDKVIYVTGHSKGGNLAQYVTMFSDYRDRILKCYSIDGQGFSIEAETRFLSQQDYQVQVEKMISINGENDYVNPLGKKVIPDNQTFYISTPNAHDIVGFHDIAYLFYDEVKDEHGNPIALQRKSIFSSAQTGESTLCEQGVIGEFATRLSEEMMKLGEEDLEDCAISIMYLMESLAGSPYGFTEGTAGREKASIEEFCGFISVGVPLILKTAITTEEGRAAVGSIAIDAISGLAASENGGKMIIAMCAVVLICAPAVVVLGQTLITAGVAVWKGATLVDSVLGLFDDTFELSDVKGAAIVAKVIAKAAMFLAANPHIVVAVLAIVAVVALVTYIVQHWDEIKAFIKATGDFFIGLATALYAWAENLVTSAINLIKAAIGKAVNFYQNVKQAIVNFGNRLMSEAINFFTKISQAVIGFLGSIAKWAKGLFGGGSGALGAANQIVVTISRIEEMQRRIAALRSAYLDAEKTLSGTEGVVRRVYNYYDESYVRSCCRDIQNDLEKAQRYINSIERELDRKRRALATAVDAYRKADQNAARDIRKAVASFV